MRIAILTLATGARYRRLVRCGLASKRYYGRKQGIPFILARDECHDHSRPPAWSKLTAVRRHLPKHNYIFLSDADVVFMNPDIDLRKIIREEMGDREIMLTIDCNGLQTGNIFLKNTPFVFDLLDRMDRQTHLTYHQWWEQAAFIELYETDPEVRRRTVTLQNQRIFNSVASEIGGDDPRSCYRPGDLLVHFPSLRGNQLQSYMKSYYVLLKKRQRLGRIPNLQRPDRADAPVLPKPAVTPVQ